MRKLHFFYGPDCPKCKDAEPLISQHKGVVIRHNVGETDGLAEAAYLQVTATPSIVITATDENGSEWVVKKFTSNNLPTIEELNTLVSFDE